MHRSSRDRRSPTRRRTEPRAIAGADSGLFARAVAHAVRLPACRWNFEWRRRGARRAERRTASATIPRECLALSGWSENAQAETVRDNRKRLREHVGTRDGDRKCVVECQRPTIDRDGGPRSRRPRRNSPPRTTRPLTRSMRRVVVRSVIRSLVGRKVRHRMSHRRGATMDLNVVAAAGFRGARTQQETGEERHKGDSSVPG